MNQATCETCPLHIWKHDVHTTAAALVGRPVELTDELNAKVVRWYHAGEPVWMAADGLAHLVRERVKIERVEREDRALKALFAKARRQS